MLLQRILRTGMRERLVIAIVILSQKFMTVSSSAVGTSGEYDLQRREE
jgi:hypothetical protein